MFQFFVPNELILPRDERGELGQLFAAQLFHRFLYFRQAHAPTVAAAAPEAIRSRPICLRRVARARRLRLRPILMTSFAFIFGVVPLVVSSAAGAEMRQALGTAVFFGMLGVTGFGLFLTPVFYVVIMWFKERRAKTGAPASTEPAPPLTAEPALH